MQRRQLLGYAGAAALPFSTFRALATPATGSNLLLVFLRGGYDAASLLVPVSSDFYYEARPNIAIARPADNPDSALALSSDWGLHPALRASLLPLVQARQLAFVPFSGTEDLSRSHFETQDSIEMGLPIHGARNFRSGFLNRLAGVLNGAPAMAFTDQMPLALQGPATTANLSLRNVAGGGADTRQAALIASMYQGTRLAEPVKDSFELRQEVRDMDAEMKAANRNAISAKGFEAEARRMARLMRERYSIGFVDVGGWDTHVGQGAARGQLASRLDELGRGLAAFSDEMGPAWNRSTVVVISEFGRTFRENGNRGTDHGHGSVMWVLGGATKPSPVLGETIPLTPASLFQNRDWPVLNDYRSVLGGVFARQFALKPADLQKVFPSAQARDLGLA